MIKLTDILNEIKQVGPLYHFTYLNNISKIFEKGMRFVPDNTELPKYKNKFYISTTRDHTGHKFIKDWELTVRVTLDGNKISEHYLIEPINTDNIWSTVLGLNQKQSSKGSYFEERIFSSKPGYLNPKYIIKIDTIVPESEIKRHIMMGKEDSKRSTYFNDSIYKYIDNGKLNFVKNFNNK